MNLQNLPILQSSQILKFALIFFIGLIVGSGTTFVLVSGSDANELKIKNAYQAGFDNAKSRVMNSSIGGILKAGGGEIHTISGEIKGVDNNRISLHYQLTDPFEDPSLADRVAIITGDTKIYRLVEKNAEDFQKEMEQYLKLIQSEKSNTSLTQPMQFNRRQVTQDEVKVGLMFNVISKENISSIKEFNADEIELQPDLVRK